MKKAYERGYGWSNENGAPCTLSLLIRRPIGICFLARPLALDAARVKENCFWLSFIAAPPCQTGGSEYPLWSRGSSGSRQGDKRRGRCGCRERVPCRVCRTSKVRLSTGPGWLFSARLGQAELKRIWPSGGKFGGSRRVRMPSQTACASASSVARRAQS